MLVGYIPLYWILPKWYEALGVMVAIVVMVRFVSSTVDNEKALMKIRAEKSAYHTKSPGKSRWDNPRAETRFRIISALGILLTSPLAGIAYISSMAISANLKREQTQKIYNNYLDARDNQIEAEFMERALKGEIPAEITYLYEPLSKKYDEETRNDIANTWVAGTPKSVARPPQPGAARKSPATDGPEPGPKPPQSARPSAQAPETEPPKSKTKAGEDDRVPPAEEELRKTVNEIFPYQSMSREKFVKLWKLGSAFRRFYLYGAVILFVVIAGIVVFDLVKASHDTTPVASASVPAETKQPVALAVPSQVQPAAPPVVQDSGHDNFTLPMQAQQQQLAKERAAQLLEQARQEQLNKERLEAQAINQLVNQIKVATTNENAALESFAVQGNSFWVTVSNRIAKLPHRRQSDLWEQAEMVHTTFQNLVVADQGLLEKVQSHYPNMTSSTKSKLQALWESLAANFAKVETNRRTVFNQMAQLDASITEAEKKRGFWPF